MVNESTKRNKNTEGVLGQKIIGLLLKKAMSQTDLAKEIYGKANVRSGISKWIKIFLKEEWITERATNKKTILYTANLETLGKFDEDEIRFIHFVIKRFWNPSASNSFESLTNLLVLMLSIKKLSKIKDKINGYSPKSNLEYYRKNKKKFWEDEKFRNEFLDKIKQKTNKLSNKKILSFYLERDFIFVSLITPKNIVQKLDRFRKSPSNPLFVLLKLL